MTTLRPRTFSLDVDGGPALAVQTFLGTEELSRPFEFQVDFVPLDGRPIQWMELLNKPATLAISSEGAETRYVHGHVDRVEALEKVAEHPRYCLRLVPDLQRLRHVHRSRVFQELSTRQIVSEVLDGAQVKHRWSLSGNYEKHEYCVQYRETTFDFISRLLEWEGIFYYFEHAQDGHVLVLSDDVLSATDISGRPDLLFREASSLVPGEEHFTRFEDVRRVTPATVVTREFDFKSPALDLTATTEAKDGLSELELSDYAEGYVAPADGKRVARLRLQEQQQRARTHQGKGTCCRLSPGYNFRLKAPAPEGMAGEYFAVRVRHSGESHFAGQAASTAADAVYRNELRCLPHGTPFRPRRHTRWPVVPGIQTATVVGAAGEEIHPDEHGRIKVQFHWDREGAKDDHSSCFIRVGQAWGGPAWGALFLPRVGQEVVVRFLEGDPDRPLITGAVYNGQNPPPYTLPDDKTKSTLKSSSSLGGDGFNELRLEDAAGEEEIFVHAQKDEKFITENDKAQEVRRNEDRLVKKDRTKTVEGNQALEVALNDSGQVDQNQTLQVTGNRATTVNGNHVESVVGTQGIQVAQNQNVQVALASSTTVGGAGTLQVGGALSITVGMGVSMTVGGMSSTVGGDSTEAVKGSGQEQVSKDMTSKMGDGLQAEVKGQLYLGVGKDLTIQVDGAAKSESTEETAWSTKTIALKADKLTFVVNEKRLLMLEQSGDVTLTATSLSVDGSDIKLKGASVKHEQPSSPPSAQHQALKVAAVHGVPFCEECERRRKAAAVA